MNAARISSSARLRRVLCLLRDGREHSTRDIADGAHVCAVSACVAELRANGHDIACRIAKGEDGERVWLYRLQA
jgi:hypothetical protein